MLEIFDKYCWEKNKKVITKDRHGIPGLGNFAYWSLSRAVPPTPLHHHSDIIEIHCLIKGKRNCYVNDETYTVTGNELFLTFPYEAHSTGNYYQHPISFYAFQMNMKNKDAMLGLNKEYSRAVHQILSELKSRHLKMGPGEIELLKNAFENINDGNKEALYLGVQYLSCFLFKIPELVPITKRSQKKLDHHLKRVLEYIEEHYTEEIHLKELAVMAGYSLSRFKIKFKEEVGITPAIYITFRKLDLAENLLRNTNMSVTQIALDAGFSSSNYFCTVLKKFTNKTPTEIRNYFEKGKTFKPPNQGKSLSFNSPK